MTNEENIKAILESNFAGFKGEIIERATKSILELKPKKSDDAIHRGDVLTAINDFCQCVEEYGAYNKLYDFVENLSPVSTEKTGRCKDCKHFVYDEFAIVNGIPIIVAHEICMRWSDGCKTKEDGYCHMFEPKTQEVEE